MIVIIDTNVWISGVFWIGGTPFKILYYFDKHIFDVAFSKKTFDEFVTRTERLRKKYQFSSTRRERYLRLIRKYGLFVETLSTPNVCRDPDDNSFLAVAEAAKANYLVTGDKDLLTLKKYKKTKIVKPKEFLKVLNKLH